MNRSPRIQSYLSATVVVWTAFFCGCANDETHLDQETITLTSHHEHDKEVQEAPAKLALEGGYIETGLNELSVVSTVDDPPGLRLGVQREKEWGRSMGKFSFNSVRADGVQDECVLIQGKLDERYPLEDLVGEYVFFLRTPPGGGDEGDMVPVLTLQHDRIVAHVPVVFEQGAEPDSTSAAKPRE